MTHPSNHTPQDQGNTISVTMKLFATIIATAALPALAFNNVNTDASASLFSRRETLAKSFAGIVAAAGVLGTADKDKANAFPNKISDKYDDRPKQRGSKPKNLGIGKRKDMAGEEYVGLKECGAAPNCFCSTDSIEDSPDTTIPPFKYDKSLLSSRQDAFQQLYEVVHAYEPGQSNIDGGGFEIKTFDPDAG